MSALLDELRDSLRMHSDSAVARAERLLEQVAELEKRADVPCEVVHLVLKSCARNALAISQAQGKLDPSVDIGPLTEAIATASTIGIGQLFGEVA